MFTGYALNVRSAAIKIIAASAKIARALIAAARLPSIKAATVAGFIS
jgi:hypothetical protein